jgi:hypothetical protein
MREFIVIVEDIADARTATTLAERILVEKVDWLERDQLQYLFQWRGLEENTKHSCWKDIKSITERAKESGIKLPLTRSKEGKFDGAASIKILTLVRYLQKDRNRQIKAVLFIRDSDNQPKRRESIEQARSGHVNREFKLEIIIGIADRMREAWVLNGFIPLNEEEKQSLVAIKKQLNFDPCEESHRLRSNSFEEPDRARNPKVVLTELTGGSKLREQQCWEDSSLELLQRRGRDTGLTDYLQEIEQSLIPMIHE